jgi:hypothetical protein
MSIFEVAFNAAVHAMEGTRLGAWMLGQPIDALEEVHEGLRPIRALQWQDRAQQYGQQVGAGQGGTTREFRQRRGWRQRPRRQSVDRGWDIRFGR